MTLKIDQDHSRFRAIVRGRIRENLKKYISHGELIGRKGKDVVSIPIPHIDIPRFRFGDKQSGGTGQGDGDVGDPVGGKQQDGQDGQGKAGKDAGDHVLEVDVTLEELASILGEELALPDIENRGKSKIINAKDKYTGIRRVGPDPSPLQANLPRSTEANGRARYLRSGPPVVIPSPTTNGIDRRRKGACG
jgi:hypothetical protein